jgi:D-sedoheptulose 7-phosphate isomerase
MEPWIDYRNRLSDALEGLVATGRDGAPLPPADAFGRWVRLTQDVHDDGRSLYLIGNGGSAMIASHMATDATKNGGLRALAFNDASMLTAIGNDISFEDVFALPLNRIGQRGDLLVSISSSGNSPNIVKGLEAGRRIGMHIVTLSGKRPDNRSRTLGDLNFYVPADRYGWVECAHQLLIHYWFDQYLNVYGNGAL